MRLRGYDYSQTGAYFITVCTKDRLLLLEPDPVKQMIEHWWEELPSKFPHVELDAFTVMPNHVHGIIVIVSDSAVQQDASPEHPGEDLPTIMQWFKTMTTNAYMKGVKEMSWGRFNMHLWQRTYWDHIIRGESDLQRLHAYIEMNPSRWMIDSLHP
jgi:putative transposase